MKYYIKQIDNATDIDALTEIVEERAAFDETISYDVCETQDGEDIVYSSKKLKEAHVWANGNR